MRKEQTNVTKLGVFVTISVILFTIAVYYIGNKQNLFGANFRVGTVFSHVKGLQPGNNVRYSGIDIGIVDRIEILNDTTIQVEMLLERQVRSFLKKNAVAKIGSDGLVGNVIININPGQGEGQLIKEGEFIGSHSTVETDEMVNTLGTTTENIALLTVKLLEITNAIQEGEGPVARLMHDPQLSQNLNQTFENLNRTSANIEALSKQFQQNLKQEDGALGFLLQDTLFSDQVSQLTLNLDTLILYRTQPILHNMEEASIDIAQTSASLRIISQELDRKQGLLGTIIKDSIAAQDLRQILSNLNEGTYRFNENMEAMKHNFLFRKYFKKQEKEAKKAQAQEAGVASRPSNR